MVSGEDSSLVGKGSLRLLAEGGRVMPDTFGNR